MIKIVKAWKNFPYWLKWMILGVISGSIISILILTIFLVHKLHNIIAIDYFPESLYRLLDVTLDIYSVTNIGPIFKFIAGTTLIFGFVFWILSEIIYLIEKLKK